MAHPLGGPTHRCQPKAQPPNPTTPRDLPLVGASQDEAGKEFVEHDPVGDARAVAPQRMSDGSFGKQRSELVPQRVGDEAWKDRHGIFCVLAAKEQARPPLWQTGEWDRGERRDVRSMRRP